MGGVEGPTQLTQHCGGGMLSVPASPQALGPGHSKAAEVPSRASGPRGPAHQPTGYLLLLLYVGSLTGMKEQGPGVRPARVHTLPP